MGEWKSSIGRGGREEMEEELGDLIFSLVNYARFIHLNPEDAIERSNLKFIRRFSYIEDKARERGRDLSSMTFDEMEALYQESKKAGL